MCFVCRVRVSGSWKLRVRIGDSRSASEGDRKCFMDPSRSILECGGIILIKRVSCSTSDSILMGKETAAPLSREGWNNA